MARSKRYKELVKEIHTLRKYLLPRQFDPIGKYLDEELIKAIAFRVLAHAELESYVEDRVMELAKVATRSWKTNKKASCTLMGLLAFSGDEMELPPDSLTPMQPTQKSIWGKKIYLNNKIDDCMINFVGSVKKNHGIKERNLLKFLLPVGVEADSLDQTWLATMNSFGERRGESAHKSTGSYRATQQINPRRVKSS
jgi:hypothetical protein